MTTIKQLYDFACKYGCENAPVRQWQDPATGMNFLSTLFPDNGGYAVTIANGRAMDAFGQMDTSEEPVLVESIE